MNPEEPLNLLNVTIVTEEAVLFEGKAHSVILPGERGYFEVLPQHKPLLSRLIGGNLSIDFTEHNFPILRGIAKVGLNQVTAIVETA